MRCTRVVVTATTVLIVVCAAGLATAIAGASCADIIGVDGDFYEVGASGTGGAAASSGTGAAGAGGASSSSSAGLGGSTGGGGAGGNGGIGGAGATSGGGGSGGGGGVLNCDSQYDQAQGYQLCADSPTECEFRVITASSASCNEVCTGFGGECLEAWDNGSPCEYLGPSTCSYDQYGDIICVCSLGCGGGPVVATCAVRPRIIQEW